VADVQLRTEKKHFVPREGSCHGNYVCSPRTKTNEVSID